MSKDHLAHGDALAIEFPKIESLTPHPANSRLHSAAQLEQIAASMTEFGWTRPVVVDEDYIILAGHGAIRAADRIYKAGATIRDVPPGAVPVVVKRGLTDEQKRAYVIADNRLALSSEWDEGVLAAELAALQSLDYDLGLIGFAGDELDALLEAAGTLGLTEPDDIPATPDESDVVTRPGDLWQLGNHRLYCGDSTKARQELGWSPQVSFRQLVFDMVDSDIQFCGV